ncbi:MAG: hypothetical protein ACLU38_02610 [Dysosmobacter sp.]
MWRKKEEEFIAPVISRRAEAEEPAETPLLSGTRPREEARRAKDRRPSPEAGRRQKRRQRRGDAQHFRTGEEAKLLQGPEARAVRAASPQTGLSGLGRTAPGPSGPSRTSVPEQDAAPAREKVINPENPVKLLAPPTVTGADAAIAAVAAGRHPLRRNKRLSQAERRSFRSAVFDRRNNYGKI